MISVFFSNTMMFFSEWLVFSPSSGPEHVPFTRTQTPLAYGTSLFGPIECKQLLMNVCCVSVHSRCISMHIAGAYTLSVLKREGGGQYNPV